MNINLTLVTTILTTALATSAGTYYLTTRTQPTIDNPSETAAAQPPQTLTQPTPVVMSNVSPDKPIEITVKTQIVERHRSTRHHDFRAEAIAATNAPQPQYGIYKGK
jgi:hypothetical protein